MIKCKGTVMAFGTGWVYDCFIFLRKSKRGDHWLKKADIKLTLADGQIREISREWVVFPAESKYGAAIIMSGYKTVEEAGE